MYRTNLYPERKTSQQAGRRRAGQLGLGVALLGTAVLLVGLLMVSARQLQVRTAQVRAATERLQTQALLTGDVTEADVTLARAVLEVRLERIDWAPLLALLGESIGPELLLTGLRGQGPGARQVVALEMNGRFRSGEAKLDAVTAFVEGLRQDERLALTLPVCRLGEVREGERGGFTITCLRATEETR